MTPVHLLETLENEINTIVKELEDDEKSRLLELLSKMMEAEHKDAIHNAKHRLYDFCLKNPLLERVLLRYQTRGEKPLVFRGKPIPVSMKEEAKRVRLLTNRLIDAIEKSNISPQG